MSEFETYAPDDIPGRPCACSIHPSGRGLVYCLYHDAILTEHQSMYRTLQELASGTGIGDPADIARRTLAGISYRHHDKP
jgi:hypothetical protein